MSKLRAKKIKLILFDVDGVLTDGTIWIVPVPAVGQLSVLEASARPSLKPQSEGTASSSPGNVPDSNQPSGDGGTFYRAFNLIEAKGFHAHDGTAFSLARMAGIKTGFITKRISEAVALRARDLKIDHVYQGKQDKLTVFQEIIETEGITAAEAAFVGDDVIDLPVMRKGGFAVAVKNARPEVKAAAHWVTPHAGGDGAARDAIEYILRAQGKWKSVVEDYVSEKGPS
jgi:3-deoxy-D-manno-octulosonate 8-phosphate phosphatase (KDO 8-P phosphatase)